jgi:hypothetical protein
MRPGKSGCAYQAHAREDLLMALFQAHAELKTHAYLAANATSPETRRISTQTDHQVRQAEAARANT